MKTHATREYRREKNKLLRREWYYSGYLHYAFTVGFALTIGIWASTYLGPLTLKDLIVVPLAIIYANLVEYLVHRFPLHHKYPGLNMLFERHAVQHHRYFTDEAIAARTAKQYRFVLFPAVAIVLFIPFAAGPLAFLVSLALGDNAGYLTLIVAVLYFALYESLHLSNHLPRTHWCFKIPGVLWMCQFHRLHHDPRYSKNYNFNVTFPLFDLVFKTLRMSTRKEFYKKIENWITARLNSTAKKPQLIGINGSQGIGKSTLCAHLVKSFADRGIKAVSLSIDDFYYTRNEQIALAAKHADNPLLQERGYAGTHDIALGERVLRSLKNGEPTSVPVYNKSAHGGKGDRAPEKEWQKIDKSVDVVLFDGWMLGHRAVDSSGIQNPHIKEINEILPQYDKWMNLLDGFIILAPEKAEYVLQWRVEAEEKMKAGGKAGMPKGVIEAYVKSFIPAYETYLPGLLRNDPIASATLRFVIKKDRLPG